MTQPQVQRTSLRMPNHTAWPSATLAIALAHDTTHTGLEGHAPCAYTPAVAAVDPPIQRDHTQSLMRFALVIAVLNLLLVCVLFTAKRPMQLKASVHGPPSDKLTAEHRTTSGRATT